MEGILFCEDRLLDGGYFILEDRLLWKVFYFGR